MGIHNLNRLAINALLVISPIGIMSGCFIEADVECSTINDKKCPAGQICENFECLSICNTSGECGAEEACLDGACKKYSQGCEHDSECLGGFFCENAVCQRLKDDGAYCERSGECGSTFCSDERCCESECAQGCFSCRGNDTQLADGLCRTIARGFDPDGECANNGFCDGAGQCVSKKNGDQCEEHRQCQSQFCTDGVCCNSECSGSCEGCTSVITQGPNGICSPIPIFEDPQSECLGAQTCDGAGRCADGDNGQACAQASDCLSGQCIDGVCCASQCEGQCFACRQELTGEVDGQCAAVLADLDRSSASPCEGEYGCNGAGQCRPSKSWSSERRLSARGELLPLSGQYSNIVPQQNGAFDVFWRTKRDANEGSPYYLNRSHINSDGIPSTVGGWQELPNSIVAFMNSNFFGESIYLFIDSNAEAFIYLELLENGESNHSPLKLVGEAPISTAISGSGRAAVVTLEPMIGGGTAHNLYEFTKENGWGPKKSIHTTSHLVKLTAHQTTDSLTVASIESFGANQTEYMVSKAKGVWEEFSDVPKITDESWWRPTIFNGEISEVSTDSDQDLYHRRYQEEVPVFDEKIVVTGADVDSSTLKLSQHSTLQGDVLCLLHLTSHTPASSKLHFMQNNNGVWSPKSLIYSTSTSLFSGGSNWRCGIDQWGHSFVFGSYLPNEEDLRSYGFIRTSNSEGDFGPIVELGPRVTGFTPNFALNTDGTAIAVYPKEDENGQHQGLFYRLYR